jgi:hypothetical protein
VLAVPVLAVPVLASPVLASPVVTMLVPFRWVLLTTARRAQRGLASRRDEAGHIILTCYSNPGKVEVPVDNRGPVIIVKSCGGSAHQKASRSCRCPSQWDGRAQMG